MYMLFWLIKMYVYYMVIPRSSKWILKILKILILKKKERCMEFKQVINLYHLNIIFISDYL